jgi:superfamily II DNA helicase RecQ
MQVQIFSIPAYDSQIFMDEMNTFLLSHKIIDVKRRFVENDFNSYWSFCVRWVENSQPTTVNQQQKAKIDYRETLDEKTFKIYSHLREIRKKIAEDEKIPLYAIFSNEELASIAGLNEITVENIISIKGIGSKKVEKYGKLFIEQSKN